MKIWKDHPAELRAWKRAVIVKLREHKHNGTVPIFDGPCLQLPNKSTVTATLEEWRKMYSGL
jgi:hypothetical protein